MEIVDNPAKNIHCFRTNIKPDFQKNMFHISSFSNEFLCFSVQEKMKINSSEARASLYICYVRSCDIDRRFAFQTYSTRQKRNAAASE